MNYFIGELVIENIYDQKGRIRKVYRSGINYFLESAYGDLKIALFNILSYMENLETSEYEFSLTKSELFDIPWLKIEVESNDEHNGEIFYVPQTWVSKLTYL